MTKVTSLRPSSVRWASQTGTASAKRLMTRVMVSALLLLPRLANAEPSLFLVLKQEDRPPDTLRVETVIDSVWADDPTGPRLVRVDTTGVPDTAWVTAVVGDTLVLEMHALDWPEVIGYLVAIGTDAGSVPSFEPGDFYVDSGLGLSQSSVVLTGFYDIGQTGPGDSKGEGSGLLGTTRIVFSSPGNIETKVAWAELTTLDARTQQTQTLRILRRRDRHDRTSMLDIAVIASVAPLQEPVTADLDRNGVVSFSDFLGFVTRFGARSGDERYDPMLDFDGSGQIGFSDFLLLAEDFGKPPRTYRTISRG